ncbi:MAG: class I SAM-dependent methyltransferase [Pseudonocardia sp.]
MSSCDSRAGDVLDARTAVGGPAVGLSPAAMPTAVFDRSITVRRGSLRAVLHRRFFELLSRLPEPAHSRVLRQVFDRKYDHPDPWGVKSGSPNGAYQRRKFRTTLDCVPIGYYSRVLDAGCGEGAFTRLLAEAFSDAEVVGIDIAADAVERAAAMAPRQDVQYLTANLLDNSPPGMFDLVFCNEVLYYLGGSGQRRAAERLISALIPGGMLVLVHPWPEARRLHDPFDVDPALIKLEEFIDDDQHRPFAVGLYQRRHRDQEPQSDSVPSCPVQRS